MDRFQFRKLIVYKRALDLVVAIRPLAASIPREHLDLRWQLQRAARSVVLNLAEGAGEFSPREKARIYRISLRSAWEIVNAGVSRDEAVCVDSPQRDWSAIAIRMRDQG